MMTRLRNMLTSANPGDTSEPANSVLAQLFRSGLTIETDRLILRPRTFLDTDGIFEIDSDEEICRLSLGTLVQSKAEARRRVELEMAYVERGHPVPWSVVRREDREFIGTCGIVSLNDSADTIELGFASRRAYWNQGYATEALTACIELLFRETEFYRIECQCWPENLASRRVMEKSGMAFEGVLRSARKSAYGRHDACIYAILRPDWETFRQTP